MKTNRKWPVARGGRGEGPPYGLLTSIFIEVLLLLLSRMPGPSNAQQGHMVRSSHANNSVHSQSEDSTRQVYTFLGDYQVGVMVYILKRDEWGRVMLSEISFSKHPH